MLVKCIHHLPRVTYHGLKLYLKDHLGTIIDSWNEIKNFRIYKGTHLFAIYTLLILQHGYIICDGDTDVFSATCLANCKAHYCHSEQKHITFAIHLKVDCGKTWERPAAGA